MIVSCSNRKEPEGESRADDSPEDSLVKETVAAEFDVPEALEFAEKTEAVVVDDEDRMGTDAGAAPALVEDEEPQVFSGALCCSGGKTGVDTCCCDVLCSS